jgi:hypothetical protein
LDFQWWFGVLLGIGCFGCEGVLTFSSDFSFTDPSDIGMFWSSGMEGNERERRGIDLKLVLVIESELVCGDHEDVGHPVDPDVLGPEFNFDDV